MQILLCLNITVFSTPETVISSSEGFVVYMQTRIQNKVKRAYQIFIFMFPCWSSKKIMMYLMLNSDFHLHPAYFQKLKRL